MTESPPKILTVTEKSITVRANVARLSYPKLGGEPKLDDNGKPVMDAKTGQPAIEYSAILLFQPKTDLSLIRKAAFDVASKKYGPDKSKWPEGFHTPFRDQALKMWRVLDTGEKVAREGYEEGGIFVTARTTGRPPFLYAADGVTRVSDLTLFYGGCWVQAVIDFYLFERRNAKNVVVKRGIGCGLKAVQFRRDDTPFGGGGFDPDGAFTAVEDAGSAETGATAEQCFV